MDNFFYICKWISFAISSFVILEQMAWDYPAFTEGNQADRFRAFLLSGTGKGTIRKLDKEMVQWNKPKGMCDEDKMILQGWLVTRDK